MASAFEISECFAPRPTRFLGIHEHAGWRLKMYSVVYGGEELQRKALDEPLAAALRALPVPAVSAERPGVGFLILHQGRGGDYLVLAWWDRENELPLRVFVKSNSESPAHWRTAQGGESVCVCDLEILWREREAYVRTVMSQAGAADVSAYLKCDGAD